MNKILYCVLCGEEINGTIFANYYVSDRICSICDREMFEDSIGYEGD